MKTDQRVIEYKHADDMTKRRLQAFMWLMQYGSYDSTTPYIASTKQIVKVGG